MASVSALSLRHRVRPLAAASLMVILTSCGGEDGGSSGVAVVDGAAPAATPTVQPTPSPAPSPAPTPAPTPAPSPTPAPTSTPELYTVGNLTWSFEGDIADNVRQPIIDVMTWALNQTNTLADYRGNVLVRYNIGTPTAEAGYDWHIQFGGYITWNSALHELAHWLGSGTYWPWGSKVVDGRFTGPITNARIRALDGPQAVLNADWAHFWPYGYNGNDPFHEWQRNVTLVSAQRADMGLSDGAAAIAGDRRFINRSSQLLLDGGGDTGASPTATALGGGQSLTWRVTFADGYVTLTNAATGLAIDSLGKVGNGEAAALAVRDDSPRQQWEMIPTDQGWFLLRNRQTRMCLDNVGKMAPGTPIAIWSCGGHPNQQWHLVR